MPDDLRALQDAITAGLADAFTEHSAAERGALIASWVVCVELIDPEGSDWLHEIRSPGIAPWKALGMLESHGVTLRARLLESDQ